MLDSLYFDENKPYVVMSIIGGVIGICGLVYIGLKGGSDLVAIRNEVVAVLVTVMGACTGLLYMALDKLEYLIEIAEKSDSKEVENQE